MASQIPTNVPSGRAAFIGIPDSEDIPRLVYCAPYFQQIPLAELIEPSVVEAVNNVLPSLVPPYVDGAVQAGIQAQAVLLVGSTMTGPLFLNPVMPSADAQAASKAYVDTMLATAGIPEVPPVPVGQVWARETGQWVPISQTGGTFLPITGGTMQGNINMSGNTLTNMAAVPAMPNGAAPAQWVLNQIASVSLYQGTWDADTNVPDLTQLSTHVNAYTWIALTTNPAGVVIGASIPGLQGTTVFNGDTIIYSTVQGGFKAIHSGGITLPEADGRYVQLAGSQMSGALLLNANATQPLQATTLQQLDAAVANTVTPDAPADGQAYLRVGVGTNRWVPGLPLAGGILTGALTLSGNATQPLNAVPLQQVNSLITAGTTGFLPLAGGQMTGLMQLSGNASANLNPVPLQQLNSMLSTYAPIQNPTFTGSVTLPGNAASALQAVPLQQLTAAVTGLAPINNPTFTGTVTIPIGAQIAGYAPIASPTFTGSVTLPGNAASALQAVPLQQLNSVVSGYLPLTGGNLTGQLSVNAALTVNASAGITGSLNLGGVVLSNTGGTFFTGNVPINSGTGTLQTNAGISYTRFTGTAIEFQWTGSGSYNTYFGGVFTGAFTVSGSDPRLKTNVAAPTVDPLSIVNRITTQQFDLSMPLSTPQHWSMGFMSDQLRSLIPEAVISGTTETLPDGESVTTYDAINQLPLIAYLIGAAQRLVAMVQQLQGAVGALQQNANQTVTAWDAV